MLAGALNATPEFIAFGVAAPSLRAPAATLAVSEVSYEDDRGGYRVVTEWGIPRNYLTARNIPEDGARIMEIRHDHAGMGLKAGDRVLFDATCDTVRLPGVFVYWNGLEADVGFMAPQVMTNRGRMLMIRVHALDYTIASSDARIFGRVRCRLTDIG